MWVCGYICEYMYMYIDLSIHLSIYMSIYIYMLFAIPFTRHRVCCAGNDFLPHIPALEIRDGAIDMLIYAYKKLMPKLGGWLTDAGRVHLPRTEVRTQIANNGAIHNWASACRAPNCGYT